MPLQPFKLERFFAKYEFNTKYLLCVSDCEALQMSDIVAKADAESKQLWDNLKLTYTESQGLPALREEIVTAMYPTLESKDVIVLAPEEGIYLTMHALLKSSDHVVSITPGYQSLYEIARAIGCDVTLWNTRDIPNHPHHAQEFSIDDLEKLLQPNTKMVVINFPHNPTGLTLTTSELQRIVDLCKARGIYLFSDEMYRFLEHDPATRLPPAVALYDKAICLSGMSKAFGMPGIRVGWIASQDASVIARVAELKDYTTICTSGPSEILALMGLRARDELVSANLAIIKRGLDAIEAFMAMHSDKFAFQRPSAGPIAFPKLLIPGTTASAYCDTLVRDAGILLLPSSLYDVEDNRFRISFGRAITPEVVRVWDEFVSKQH
ncbi:TPA: hypothetical protein N0F65_005821 [Lagenidium giganteum]|uniref:Aminotransferase class I/classII large domain-containing protein n=1 Tax=Lagenidium giganteum TaxID=4803 RepID=A0AAV2YTT1_9STRA|nr:TPA: hypothetical protein N0F65_005821 [Lagenidium giganteum]